MLQQLAGSSAMSLPLTVWAAVRQSDPGPYSAHHQSAAGSLNLHQPCPLIQFLWDWSMFLCTGFTMCPTPRCSAAELLSGGAAADAGVDAGAKQAGETMTLVHSLITAIGQLELTLNTFRMGPSGNYTRVAQIVQQSLRPVIAAWLTDLRDMIWTRSAATQAAQTAHAAVHAATAAPQSHSPPMDASGALRAPVFPSAGFAAAAGPFSAAAFSAGQFPGAGLQQPLMKSFPVGFSAGRGFMGGFPAPAPAFPAGFGGLYRTASPGLSSGGLNLVQRDPRLGQGAFGPA